MHGQLDSYGAIGLVGLLLLACAATALVVAAVIDAAVGAWRYRGRGKGRTWPSSSRQAVGRHGRG